MSTFLTVVACIAGYLFMGGLTGSAHHAISKKKCDAKDHFNNHHHAWCSHTSVGVWLFGVFWWIGAFAAPGLLIGNLLSDDRAERRRARELAEAKHKAEVARLAMEEDQYLTRQLEAQKKGKSL